MQIIDTFSGIGGFSLAGSWIGWRTIQFCEIDPWCHKVLKKHWPNVPIHTDIKTLTPKIIKQNPLYDENEETMLTGGVPCQPASTAGKRRGESDERWLWPQTIKFIGEFRPTLAVLENVAGLVSMENGKTLDRILSDLEDEGYTTEQVIIPACAVGAWHRRDRIWIIAQNTRSNGCRNGEHDKQGHIGNIWQSMSGGKERDIRKEITGNDVSQPGCFRCNNRGYNREERHIQTDIGIAEKNKSERNGWKCGTCEACSISTDSVSQRGCSRDAGGEYAEDVRQQSGGTQHGYWDTEPSVGRVANGIPNRVDRLKGLGNAIVPQVVYQIFKAIEEYENLQR